MKTRRAKTVVEERELYVGDQEAERYPAYRVSYQVPSDGCRTAWPVCSCRAAS